MKGSTAQHRDARKWLTLPLLVLGFLLVPLVLLPAHALPGHAAMMSLSNSSAHHGEPGGHQHDHDGHVPALSNDAVTSHDGGEKNHGDPHCHVGPDYSAVALTRLVNTPPELGFLLALAFAAAAIAALRTEPAWAQRLRHWVSRPPWRTSGTSFLHFACIART